MKNINVRMSDELHARIKTAAGQDNRSWNGEAITLWAEALDIRNIPSLRHVGLAAHDGYADHSHEVRSDHLGVPMEEES